MKKIKRKINNKLRGAFGQTDIDEGTIVINKARHKNKRATKKYAKKERTMINTMVHEEEHMAHPKMTEKSVRKAARKKVARLTPQQKKKIYARYRK